MADGAASVRPIPVLGFSTQAAMLAVGAGVWVKSDQTNKASTSFAVWRFSLTLSKAFAFLALNRGAKM